MISKHSHFALRLAFAVVLNLGAVAVVPATAQDRDQTRDRLRDQVADKQRAQDQLQTRDQLRDRIHALDQQQKQDRQLLHSQTRQYGKNSAQAQAARGQLNRTREQLRDAKRAFHQAKAQAREQDRVQTRQQIHEPGTGRGIPGPGTAQRGGMGNSNRAGGGSQGGGRGPR